MKKNLIILMGLLLVFVLTACGSDIEEKNNSGEAKVKNVVSDNVKNEDKSDTIEPIEDKKESTDNSSSPHEFTGFTKDEMFSGGVEAKEYNLNSVRRGPHPSFTRLIFDFTVGNKVSDSAQEPPKYQISYSDEENKVTAVFEGVKYNSLANKVQEIKQMAPIIEDVQFTKDENKITMWLILKEKVSYQVFPLSSPARIAIVMSPDSIQ